MHNFNGSFQLLICYHILVLPIETTSPHNRGFTSGQIQDGRSQDCDILLQCKCTCFESALHCGMVELLIWRCSSSAPFCSFSLKDYPPERPKFSLWPVWPNSQETNFCQGTQRCRMSFMVHGFGSRRLRWVAFVGVHSSTGAKVWTFVPKWPPWRSTTEPHQLRFFLFLPAFLAVSCQTIDRRVKIYRRFYHDPGKNECTMYINAKSFVSHILPCQRRHMGPQHKMVRFFVYACP